MRALPKALPQTACICGARDEMLDPPATARCWHCGQIDGMRPLPWTPTQAERDGVRERPA